MSALNKFSSQMIGIQMIGLLDCFLNYESWAACLLEIINTPWKTLSQLLGCRY